MHIKETIGTKTFRVLNVIFMLFMMIITLYPLLYVVFASLSDSNVLIAHQGLLLKPLSPSVAAYAAVFNNPMIISGYVNTSIIVVAGVAVNIVMTSLGAYALSCKDLWWKKALTMFFVFTMFFSGGLIPFYFTVKQLGIDNTLLALILPGAISTFNMIILKTAFQAIPDSLTESCKIDGAGHLTVLAKLIFPLSLPTVAVIVLYYAVGHWNAWFNAMIFIRERSLYPLQLVLREILIGNDTNMMEGSVSAGDRQAISETIKYAVIIVATVPILVIYPFLQKYFVKGVLVGSVKE